MPDFAYISTELAPGETMREIRLRINPPKRKRSKKRVACYVLAASLWAAGCAGSQHPHHASPARAPKSVALHHHVQATHLPPSQHVLHVPLSSCAPEARQGGRCIMDTSCAKPTNPPAPWRVSRSDGCRSGKPGDDLTLPRSATEIDVWSTPIKIEGQWKRVHLIAHRSPFKGDAGCHQYAYTAEGVPARDMAQFSAGYVTCNRDLFIYGQRSLTVYWFNS